MTKPLTVLVVGDVFGEPGRAALLTLLPRLKREHEVDCTIVNVENAAAGFGVTPQIARDRKSTRLNSSHIQKSRMPSSA